jgi:hypothetical protein
VFVSGSSSGVWLNEHGYKIRVHCQNNSFRYDHVYCFYNRDKNATVAKWICYGLGVMLLWPYTLTLDLYGKRSKHILIAGQLMCMALTRHAVFGVCPSAPLNTNILHTAKNLRCSVQISSSVLTVFSEPFRYFTLSLPY